VGKDTSLADVVKEIHQALNGNEERFYRIPDDRKLIAQELLLFENTGSDEIERLVDSQFSMARFSIRVPYVDPTRYKAFNDSTVARFQEVLGPDVEIQATGFLAVMSRTITALLESMVRSYILALLIITPLMILLIGSLRTGLASMVPNLTPILITLGLMGWYGLVIDAFTLMIGGIAIGLAVDDTIHYMHNFRRYFNQYGDVRRANSETLRTTGRALLITSVVLSSGFFIFVFAGMENLVRFGLLTSFTIANAFLIDILVSPALMSIAYGRTQK
jgi:predicted RND superfamily exporter protein